MKKILLTLFLCTISLPCLAGKVMSTDLKPRHYTLADVDPEAVPYLEKIPSPDDYGMDAIIAARKEINQSLRQIRATQFNPNVTVMDDWVPIPDSTEKLRIRVYFPDNAKNGKHPLIFYIHGGGMIMGVPEQDEEMLSAYAAETNAVVVSPDYRLSPENPYPIPFNDCYTAFMWMSTGEGASRYNIDNSRVALGGDSAGANLATALVLKIRDDRKINIRLLLAIYPFYDETVSTATGKSSFDARLALTPEMCRELWKYYRGNYQGNSPYLDPFVETDFRNMPPVFITGGTTDPLFGAALTYSEKLEKAGVNVTSKWYEGGVHSFDDFPTKQTKEAISDWTEALKTALK